ncbi:hypothetical protein ACJ7C5_13275 [Nocardiopsis yanglingensis]
MAMLRFVDFCTNPAGRQTYYVSWCGEDGGSILDPFIGLGTTLVAADFEGYSYRHRD